MRNQKEVKAELFKHLDLVTVTLDELSDAEGLSTEEQAKIAQAQKTALEMSSLCEES